MEQKICIGKIVKTIGIKGEVKVIPLTNDIKRFSNLENCYLNNKLVKIEKVMLRSNFVSIKFENINTPEQAMKLKDLQIFVDRKDAVKLKQDEFFIVDLIDCELIDENNKFVGKVIDVENFGASDIIVFKQNNNEYRAPFLKDVFVKFDCENKKIYVSKMLYEVMV